MFRQNSVMKNSVQLIECCVDVIDVVVLQCVRMCGRFVVLSDRYSSSVRKFCLCGLCLFLFVAGNGLCIGMGGLVCVSRLLCICVYVMCVVVGLCGKLVNLCLCRLILCSGLLWCCRFVSWLMRCWCVFVYDVGNWLSCVWIFVVCWWYVLCICCLLCVLCICVLCVVMCFISVL